MKIHTFPRTTIAGLCLIFATLPFFNFSITAQQPVQLEVIDIIRILATTPEGANLEGLILTESNLSFLNFSNANLNRTTLNGAILTDAVFIDSSMIYTDLSGALLDGVIFQDADLRNASLSGASLSRADLRGANLSGATISDTFIQNTLFDETTIMPDGRNWSADMNLEHYINPLSEDFIMAEPINTVYIEESDLLNGLTIIIEAEE